MVQQGDASRSTSKRVHFIRTSSLFLPFLEVIAGPVFPSTITTDQICDLVNGFNCRGTLVAFAAKDGQVALRVGDAKVVYLVTKARAEMLTPEAKTLLPAAAE